MRDNERMAVLSYRNTLAIDATLGITSSPHFLSHMDFLNNMKSVFSRQKSFRMLFFKNFFMVIKYQIKF